MKTYFSLKDLFYTNNIKKSPACSPKDLLMEDIRKTQTELETAYSGFDNVTDPDLIDCYIYQVNSALKRYRFLIQQAQNMQLCEAFENKNTTSLLTEQELVVAMPYTE